ncbi:MAG: DUF5654 family protein [bacterium]|nr:DUF5654 family protein [bacterium]
MKKYWEKIRDEQRNVRMAVREKMLASITAAFGLIVGLAWNDAVRGAIESFFPPGEGILLKFVYAIIVTIIVAAFIYYVSKWFSTEDK